MCVTAQFTCNNVNRFSQEFPNKLSAPLLRSQETIPLEGDIIVGEVFGRRLKGGSSVIKKGVAAWAGAASAVLKFPAIEVHVVLAVVLVASDVEAHHHLLALVVAVEEAAFVFDHFEFYILYLSSSVVTTNSRLVKPLPKVWVWLMSLIFPLSSHMLKIWRLVAL